MTKEEIVGIQDRQVKEIKIPVKGWEGKRYYVRTITAREYDWFEKGRYMGEAKHEEHLKTWRERLAALFLCDETGRRIFNDDEAVLLAGKSQLAIDIINKEGRELNALSNEVMQELEKNSEQTQRSDSGTDSLDI